MNTLRAGAAALRDRRRPARWPASLLLISLLAAAVTAAPPGPAQAPVTGAVEAAEAAARAWLALVDGHGYGASWDAAAPLQARVPRARWEASLEAVRAPLGVLRVRVLQRATPLSRLPGAAGGEGVALTFLSAFAGRDNVVETVTAVRAADGRWQVAGYLIH